MRNRFSSQTTGSRTAFSNESIKRRILLVDDEPDITMSISVLLESNGFEISSYNDSVLALTSFKPNYYDLVILDVKMPKIDGFELYNKIRKIDKLTKVCFITATDKTDYKDLKVLEEQSENHKKNSQLYCELKKDMFLQKPISNNDLVNEINKRTEI